MIVNSVVAQTTKQTAAACAAIGKSEKLSIKLLSERWCWMEINGFGGSFRGAFGKRTRSTEMKQVSIGHKKPGPRTMSVCLMYLRFTGSASPICRGSYGSPS